MSGEDKELITKGGVQFPQVYDERNSKWVLMTRDDLARTELRGSVVEEQLTEADATTGEVTFSESINFIGVYNTDTSNVGVFNVNGIDITVPPGEVFEGGIGGTPNPVVTISGSTTYIITRYV